MAENKKSFVLYCDLIHTVSQLPDDKAGLLFKHILEYVNDNEPISDDLIVNISFEPIKQQLKRDLKKYENTCNRNKINGLKGGRPKTQKNPKNPVGYSGNPTEPKKPDTDTDTDTDIKDKDTFIHFWDAYAKITKMPKTDRKPTEKYWDKLNIEEQRKAYKGIKPYFDSLKDKIYCKKARTYLSDKNYNDEFDIKVSSKYKYLTKEEKERRQVNTNSNYIWYTDDIYKLVKEDENGSFITHDSQKIYI